MLAGNWLTCIILQTYHVYSTLKRPGNCRFVSTWNIGAVFVFIHKTLFSLKCDVHWIHFQVFKRNVFLMLFEISHVLMSILVFLSSYNRSYLFLLAVMFN